MSGIYISSYDFQYLKDSNLGGRLRFFRQHMVQYKGSDYTITSLGSRLGVTPQSISAIERGDSKNPSFLLVHKLTREYRVPLDSVTDEFYQGEENLFSIGKPDVTYIDDEDFFLEDDDTENDKDQSHEDDVEDYFSFNDSKGLLLYQCYDKQSVTPLLHVRLKEDISHNDIFHLTSRLIFETSMLKNESFNEEKALHPFVEASDLLDRIGKSLSAEELLSLLSDEK
ncbi:hypothetical protein JCM21714_2997 [Gracilibacillus boraciitolerans JCM 21714]|uniref:HTH cro/C1-type domain-containing protein n=1 Tax=Gracilibacillus boraciitolerans JCM 21714 TaxID=1298598 RepID=W4VKH7_9BACI|nr:helix-turn-helix domain-containing protein [Gracilibacillus boraciitolerans]GAE93885.1 hypothetical protein JCM21714_2997 [Gracilibacillus boraciitolerans JCM 21714]